MNKKAFLFVLPFLCLGACSNSNELISPFEDTEEFVLRNGELWHEANTEYPFAVESNEVANIGSEITGETTLYYFSSETCSFCNEVKGGLYSFIEDTSLKIIGLSPTTSPSYNDAVTRFKLSYPDTAGAFFKSWGTPLMFSFKNGEFAKIEIYGNHKNKNGVAKLLSGLFSYPYIYEFKTESSLSSFLGQGYPVLLLESKDCWNDFYEFAKLSHKRSGVLIKNKLASETISDLEEKYGSGSRLIFQKENVAMTAEKESAITLLKSYFAS